MIILRKNFQSFFLSQDQDFTVKVGTRELLASKAAMKASGHVVKVDGLKIVWRYANFVGINTVNPALNTNYKASFTKAN